VEEEMENLLSSGGGLLLFVLMTAISGFAIGALARWIIPGPDPMSIGKTILLGIAGSVLGGIVGSLFRLSPLDHPFWILLLEIACAVFLLWAFKRYRSRPS
jgi:uncharacterized membrane protein YeaQ/YmgE (transglycosylase-associated protein family)